LSPPWLGWPLWHIYVTNDHVYVPLVINTFRSFPHTWLITGFVTRSTRRVSLVEQELLTLPEHLSSPPVFVGSCNSIFSFMCMFCRSLFVLFLLVIMLSVLLRYTDSDYPFGILKLFLLINYCQYFSKNRFIFIGCPKISAAKKCCYYSKIYYTIQNQGEFWCE
jgi:hypothetical protein